MKEKYIRSLIRLVEESEIGSLEVSSWGRKIRITSRGSAESNGHQLVMPVPAAPVPAPGQVPMASPTQSASPSETAAASSDTGNLIEIKSPMVGTLYVAPSPESPSYVSMNEKITEGQVVCIVEAMKLMNEIEAEVSGRVAKICVENAQPVEFGQVMFLIDPAG